MSKSPEGFQHIDASTLAKLEELKNWFSIFCCNLQQVKGLTKEELATRSDLVAALPDRIQSIPDGSSSAKKNGTWGASGSRTGGAIKFDTSG